ncbi:MAG: zinc-binding dehydrogenase, partial [Thermodesulfovibrionales bacterium]|nr:zinc-binding dehydrogenase [Thermodesulfovibrionales bacterium]
GINPSSLLPLDKGRMGRVNMPSPPVEEGKDEGYSKINNVIEDFDYVFECTGMPEVWEASVNYVRRGGTVVLFGGCKSGTTVSYDTERLHYDEITLKGVFHYTPADVKKAYKLLCNKNLNVSRLISGRFPLKQTQKAFEKLSKGVGIKYAIIP